MFYIVFNCNTYVPTQLSMLAHAGGLKSPERCLRCPIGTLAGNKSVKKHHEYVNIDHPKANGRRAGAYPGVTAQMFDWMWDRGGKWWSPDTLSLSVNVKTALEFLSLNRANHRFSSCSYSSARLLSERVRLSKELCSLCFSLPEDSPPGYG